MNVNRVEGAIIVNEMIFTKGMTVRDARAKGIAEETNDVEYQIRKTMEVLKLTLENAGSSLKNVVKATVYLADIYFKNTYLNPIWNEFFKENAPMRTCVQAVLQPGDEVEIEIIATQSLD